MTSVIQFFGLFILLTFVQSSFQVNTISIGVINGHGDDLRQNTQAFWSRHDSNDVSLKPKSEYLNWWSSVKVTRAVCSLLKEGIYSIATSAPTRHYPILQAYAKHFGIPLLTTHAPTLQANRSQNFEITLNPNSSAAVGSLVKHYQCGSVIFLYDEDDGPDNLENILNSLEFRLPVKGLWRISIVHEAFRYLETLKDNDKQICIILDLDQELANDIFSTFPSRVRLRDRVHFILANPVGILSDKNLYVKHPKQTLTKLSLIDPNIPALKDFITIWDSISPLAINFDKKENIPYSAIMMSDMGEVLESGFSNFLKQSLPSTMYNFTPAPIDCLTENKPSISERQILITSSVQSVNLHSKLTGNIQFSTTGERVGYKYNVYEIGHPSMRKIGTWSTETLLNLTINTNIKDKGNGRSDNGITIKPAFRRKLVVKVLLSSPFVMLKENASAETGNDRYEGYLKDIMDEVANAEDWDYEMIPVKDGRYGLIINSTWVGLVGELIRGEADIGVGDLTITTLRETVIDFSRPTLTFGLNILMKKPKNVDITSLNIGILGFIQVWTYEVWLLIALFYVVLSGLVYAVSRFIGEPDRIRSLDTKLSDRLSVCSSFWFAFGSIVFRSTGIYPRSASHRALTVVWWTFSLLLLTSYISSLTFSLLQSRLTGEESYSRNSLDIIKDAIYKGHPKVGTIARGSTYQFFQNADFELFKQFGQYLKRNSNVLSSSSKEAFQRVIDSNGDYATVLESPFTHYLSNVKSCETMVSTGFLDYKAYGFSFKKGSPLRESVDYTLLNLMEKGVLRRIYEKWWHPPTRCDDPYLNILPSIYSDALTLKEVSGIFYVLIAGIVIAIATGILEYFVQTKKLSVDE